MAGHTENLIQEIIHQLDRSSLQTLQKIYDVLKSDNIIDFDLPRPTPVEHPTVSGLFYVANVLTEEEEQSYINYMESNDFSKYLNPIKSTVKNAKKEPRLVAYFGSNYNVMKAKPDSKPAPPIPPFIDNLGELALKILPRPPSSDGTIWKYDMVVLNRYEGSNKQGIGRHIDANGFGHTVISYTFKSGTIMRFTRPNHDPVDVYVEPRSLYIMTNEARSKWAHEMPGRLSDTVDGKKKIRGTRYSITMRMIDPLWKSN